MGFEIPELDKKNIYQLKLDIEKAGKILEPITVMPSAAGGYVIIGGWIRFHIAKELQLDCPALLYEDLSHEEAREMFLSKNFCHRQMKYEKNKQLAFDLYKRASLNYSQIARLLGISPSTVCVIRKSKV